VCFSKNIKDNKEERHRKRRQKEEVPKGKEEEVKRDKEEEKEEEKTEELKSTTESWQHMLKKSQRNENLQKLLSLG
jgi:hypothetical protein